MINLKYDTRPYFAHAPGRKEFIPTWQIIKNYALKNSFCTKTPKDMTIITFNSSENGYDENGYNEKILGTFEKSLDRCGCEYTVLRSLGKWKNINKIHLLKNFLPSIKTKYILVSDSSDVVILRGLETFIEDFNKFNKKAIFNAEKIIWPPDLDSSIKKFEEKKHSGHYLNAGLWVGELEFAKKILASSVPLKIGQYENSEQRFYKHAYKNFNNQMGIDIKCELFQGLNRCDLSELSITKKTIKKFI